MKIKEKVKDLVGKYLLEIIIGIHILILIVLLFFGFIETIQVIKRA
jgi:hypothetical protein